MTIDDSIIQKIVEQILQVAHPDRVILFGSAATESMTADSDLDLLVIEEQVVNIREESFRLHAALAGLHLPIDLIVMNRERFEETKNVIGGIAYPAHKYGKIIYEAA